MFVWLKLDSSLVRGLVAGKLYLYPAKLLQVRSPEREQQNSGQCRHRYKGSLIFREGVFSWKFEPDTSICIKAPPNRNRGWFRSHQDIPKISDKDFSVTLNAFFVVRWKEDRLIIDEDRMEDALASSYDIEAWIPVDVSFIRWLRHKRCQTTSRLPTSLSFREVWLPDTEILNLKEFKTLRVLSNLEGLWLNKNFEIM